MTLDVQEQTRRVREYWNSRIHDLEMTDKPPGSMAFFQELDAYRFDKLAYLPQLVNFNGYCGKRLVEVGCGIGTDLARFARGGAKTLGVDLSETAIRMARRNFEVHVLPGHFVIGDGSRLPLPHQSVDVFYAHGVLQYAADPRRIVIESQRVLKKGGTAIFMVYNRASWLMAMSKLMKVPLEHADAPGLRMYSIDEFARMLEGFTKIELIPERFPVKSRLHRGWKGALYNTLFVGAFNALPRSLVRRYGFHLMAICTS